MEKRERVFGVIAQIYLYIYSNVYYFWLLSNLSLTISRFKPEFAVSPRSLEPRLLSRFCGSKVHMYVVEAIHVQAEISRSDHKYEFSMNFAPKCRNWFICKFYSVLWCKLASIFLLDSD